MINRLPKAKLAKPQKKNTEILDYRHKGAKRKNNPEEGLAIYLPEEKGSQKYSYDPHLDPQLIWSGKAERSSFEVPVVPLHIHERVSPRNIVGVLEKKRGHQLRLFDEAEFPLDKRVDFYKHDMDWANRLILGDSLLVMNSLLTKELMGGKVQMIYFDPPYGISYNSNFQSQIGQTNVKDKDDISLTREPEQIRAYRDTWELGIHSYLTYLRDRISLARELLSDTGSIFVQIGDENIHLARNLMDEVFGSTNFVSLISFRTKIPLRTTHLAGIADYILWYAKDIARVKVKKLFLTRFTGGDTQFSWLELPDRTRRKMNQDEREDTSLIPNGARPFRLTDLVSAGRTESCVYEFEYDGRKFFPSGGKSWKTNAAGMAELIRKRRVMATGNQPAYVFFQDDYPVQEMTNLWTDTQGASEKQYAVQTSDKVIQRCLLMATDPGDLVLDPTCGSGTTAFVAEQWGRRWITCDTSRVALSIAKQRLMTAVYRYFVLAQPQEGVKSGFLYKEVPHVTLRTIAQNEPPEKEILYDKPDIDNTAIRVTGPFTTEAIPAPSMESRETVRRTERASETEEYISTLIQAIKKSGIIFPQGKILRLQNVVPISSAGFIHAEAFSFNGENRRVAISFGPRYGPLSARQAEEAIRSATVGGYSLLILTGFQIDPAAEAFVQRTDIKLDVQFAHINPDMEIHDLLKQTQGSQLFSVFGEPDIDLKRVDKVKRTL